MNSWSDFWIRHIFSEFYFFSLRFGRRRIFRVLKNSFQFTVRCRSISELFNQINLFYSTSFLSVSIYTAAERASRKKRFFFFQIASVYTVTVSRSVGGRDKNGLTIHSIPARLTHAHTHTTDNNRRNWLALNVWMIQIIANKWMEMNALGLSVCRSVSVASITIVVVSFSFRRFLMFLVIHFIHSHAESFCRNVIRYYSLLNAGRWLRARAKYVYRQH